MPNSIGPDPFFYAIRAAYAAPARSCGCQPADGSHNTTASEPRRRRHNGPPVSRRLICRRLRGFQLLRRAATAGFHRRLSAAAAIAAQAYQSQLRISHFRRVAGRMLWIRWLVGNASLVAGFYMPSSSTAASRGDVSRYACQKSKTLPQLPQTKQRYTFLRACTLNDLF